MQKQVQARIDALRNELEVGQHRMQELEQQLAQLRDTLLRISGAIQVLEELQVETTPAAIVPDGENGPRRK